MLRFRDRPWLVWDAGLGTILEMFAFPMAYPDPQPDPVVEALLRRIIALRYLIAGRSQEAANQVKHAERLLIETPFDRYHQVHSDAEGKFNYWLLTEMQERFALGHELAHHLRDADPDGFERFSSLIHDVARALLYAGEPRKSELSTRLDYSDHDKLSALYDRGLNPYAWYLRLGKWDGARLGQVRWRSQVLDAIAAFGASPSLREEITCDLLASLAVGLDAHLRQNGWTAIMGVSCSRLALASLGTIIGIDEWIAGRQATTSVLPEDVRVRGKCMDVILPSLLPLILREHGPSSLESEDIRAVLQLVSARNEETVRKALAGIHRAPAPPDCEPLSDKMIIALAGFFHLRL